MMFRAALITLLGAGAAAAVLFLLDLLRIPWNAWTLAAGLIAAASLLWTWLKQTPRTAGPGPRTTTATAINCVTAVLVLAHAIAGMRPGLWDWTDWLITRRDYFFIWGYKARLFFVEHGIPWSFLRTLPNDFSHPDYPVLVPLLFDVPAVLTSSFDPRVFAWIDAALGGALLVVAYRCLRDELTPTESALGTLALSGSALLPWFGFADGPLLAFAASAALLIRRALRGHTVSLGVAVALLSLAAMTKNEGIAFFVAVCIAAPNLIRKLWPAGVVIGGWLVARAAMHLPTDVFVGPLLPRIAHNVAMFPSAFANVPVYQPIVWIVALVAIALAPAANLRRERFLLTVAAVQLCFYLGAYAMTPYDVRGHVNGSWERISGHVTMLIAFAGLTSIRESLRR
jgi:hypothetical protein